MAIIKCKMCGGDIELNADRTIGTCDSCGSTMTLPKIDDDQRAAAFNRGNHFRRIGEFDKALAVYERIVQEDDTDAEAHWCCALCRFGIEYVEDPDTHEWLPTCHRASFDSFLEDVDYQATLAHADAMSKRRYKRDAEKIAQVQRGILALSQNEEPFDVFICYKETDADGQRTRDSMLAQDIYYNLTEQGYRVFFARITLEDKAGTQYEPYIFAALNSAKVMIVVGTSEQNLSAVWVKNEWSRFLSLMRKDRSKLLIPCYREMDPYDMPEQLSVLQSYDMSRIGFIQDLVRGIGKVVGDKKESISQSEPTHIVYEGGQNNAALLRRGGMALEDGDWKAALDFFDRVLDAEPECAQAYLGKFLAEVKARSMRAHAVDLCAQVDMATNVETPIAIPDESERIAQAVGRYTVKGYLKPEDIACLFGTAPSFTPEAPFWEKQKAAALRALELRPNFVRARSFAQSGSDQQVLRELATFGEEWDRQIREAKRRDAETYDVLTTEYADELEKDENSAAEIYASAAARREKDYAALCERMKAARKISEYQELSEKFAKIDDFEDCARRVQWCQSRYEKLKARRDARIAEEKRKKALRKKILKIVLGLLFVIGIGVFVAYKAYFIPKSNYQKAERLLAAGDCAGAAIMFDSLGTYSDAAERAKEAYYLCAEGLLVTGDYSRAAMAFYRAGRDQKDARARSLALWGDVAKREIISAGDEHTVGLHEDGTVVAVGSNGAGQCDVDGWTNIVSVSAGCIHTVGLRADGTVVATGSTSHDVDTWTDIVAVSAGWGHTVGLRADGTVVAVGENDYGQCIVGSWTNIVAVSAGRYHTVGLCADGTVVAVGNNDNGQCDVGGWTDIVAVYASGFHTVGLHAYGTVVAVGRNSYGQCEVNNWMDIVAVSAGWLHTVGLCENRTVVTVGGNGFAQCDVDGWTDIVAASAGWMHTVGLRADGTVVAVGNNDDGQCDVDSWTDIMMPQSVRARQAENYAQAESLLAAGDIAGAAAQFALAGEYSDSAQRANKLYYTHANALLVAGDYEGAAETFASLGTYEDAAERANEAKYSQAEALLAQGDYEGAAETFASLGTYKDAAVRAKETEYMRAEVLLAQGDYVGAAGTFASLGTYEDAAARVKETRYSQAEALLAQGDYAGAAEMFALLGMYEDAADRANEAQYFQAEALLAAENYAGAAMAFYEVKSYQDAWARCLELWDNVAERKSLSAGYAHTVGLREDGTVVAGYFNGDGQCDVDNWTDIVAVSAGSDHTVGLRSNGTVVAVGFNRNGQCNVDGWTDIVAVSAGNNHTVGLRADGTVVAVGYNNDNQCDVSDWTDIVAVSAGSDHTVGLRADGTVIAVGSNFHDKCDVNGWTDIVAVSAGSDHTVGLRADGTVMAVGYNDDNQCDVSGWTHIVAVSAGINHTVGLRVDGTVVAVGETDNGQCNVSEWTEIVVVTAGYNYTVGLRADGTVVAVGSNLRSQCDVSDWTDIMMPPAAQEIQAEKYRQAETLLEAKDYVGAAIGFYKARGYQDAQARSFDLWEKITERESINADSHVVGLYTDGTAIAAGFSLYNRCDVGDWTDIVAVSAGGLHTVGLRANGTVTAVGPRSPSNEFWYGQCNVSSWTDIVSVSAGWGHTVGLCADGTVVAVGRNNKGQCNVANWEDIVTVSAGGFHTIGLRADGTVVATGDDENGKCDVADWKNIMAVSAGMYHSVGLQSDGTVVATGYNSDGQCDVTAWKNIMAVSAGEDHTVGLRTDGTVIAVGDNKYGQCNVSSWRNIVAVSAGDCITIGLCADGTVLAVGDDESVQRDVANWSDIKQPEYNGKQKN